ncbi:MAG: ABC transporter substrate-binding protein [Chloroflexi bacterium]|nr:ABC transporter substrate-binding protein [Chloroflexota bacterium]
MHQSHNIRIVGLLVFAALAAAIIAACSTETIVERTVIVEIDREVPGPVQTVIVERAIKGDEIIVERTVIVEREVEVVIDRTVVVTKAGIPVTVVVVATPVPEAETFFGLPLPVVPENVGTAPAPQSPSGAIVVRAPLELRLSGLPEEGGGLGVSIVEKFFTTDAGGNAVNLLADSWVLADDLSSLTISLVKGVQFHGGFGEMTADDVVWSYNRGNPGTNPVSVTDGGSNWISFLGNNEVVAIDTYTVKFTIATFDPRWATFLLGQSGLSLAVNSKAAFDQMGEDWARENLIGTGPFKVDNYSRDDILELSAVEGHWRITPDVKFYTERSIPDEAVAEAALKTGAVDISEVPLRNMTAMQKAGFIVIGAGAGSFHSISFSGNYWEGEHFITGEPLLSAFGNGTFNDSPWMARNDGEHEEEMENARLVRTALSLAIDRELISEVLFAGAAWPNYVYGADINNPNWQDKWATPYDPVLAGQLLDQAGYPKNDKGIRFEMPFFIRIGRGDEEIGTAVVGMWRELGVDMQEWKAQYQTYRPNLVGRTAVAPWIHSAGAESPQAPWDWPVMGNSECSRGRGGFNIGIEIRELCEFFVAMSAEGDIAKRIELRNANVEFLAFWMPVIGTVARPNVALANPNKLESWDMPLNIREAATHHPEFIKLK